MKVFGYIYLIYDQKRKKVYIGQKIGSPENTTNYYGSGKIISAIIKKHGLYFLKKRVLGVCMNKKELDKAEIECISFFNSTNFLYGYNLVQGGGGTVGYKHTEETKRLISASGKNLKGIKRSEETKKKISIAQKGKKNPESQKEKVRNAHHNGSYEQKRLNMVGRILSNETKQKMSESRTGLHQSDEKRQKCKEAKLGKRNPMYKDISEEDTNLIVHLYKNEKLKRKHIAIKLNYSEYIIFKVLKEELGIERKQNKTNTGG